MHEVTLSNILTGRINPTDTEKQAIAFALRLPIDRLFCGLTEDDVSFLYGPFKEREMLKTR